MDYASDSDRCGCQTVGNKTCGAFRRSRNRAGGNLILGAKAAAIGDRAGEGWMGLGSEVLWTETLQGASTWSHVLKRGTALRITAGGEHANVGALFLNADNPSERLSLPDTLKAQHIARLTTGAVLYSDMGRILCSITDDTLGWHDPLGGCLHSRLVVE